MPQEERCALCAPLRVGHSTASDSLHTNQLKGVCDNYHLPQGEVSLLRAEGSCQTLRVKFLPISIDDWKEPFPRSLLRICSFCIPSLTCRGTLAGLSRKFCDPLPGGRVASHSHRHLASRCLAKVVKKGSPLQSQDPRTSQPSAAIWVSTGCMDKTPTFKGSQARKLYKVAGMPAPTFLRSELLICFRTTYCFIEHHLLQ